MCMSRQHGGAGTSHGRCCGQEITSPLPRPAPRQLQLPPASAEHEHVRRRNIYNSGGRLCISHLSPSSALCAAAAQPWMVLVPVPVSAHRVSQPVAAVLLSSVSLPAPSAVGGHRGFCNDDAALGLCKARPICRGRKRHVAEVLSKDPGVWGCSALGFPPPAAIHALCGASLQLDRVKRLHPKSPSARQKPRGLSAVRGKTTLH